MSARVTADELHHETRQVGDEIRSRLEQLLDSAFDRVMTRADQDRVTTRTAAMAIGVRRVWEAKQARGLFP